MQAILKDEALPGLLNFISENQSEDDQSPQGQGDIVRPIDKPTGGRAEDVKNVIVKFSGSELLNLSGWETNPEKILLLAARLEAVSGEDVWRSADMEACFADAKENPPSNFPRDIATAIKTGIIAPVTPRTYRVSRTGWNRVAEVIGKITL